MSVEAANEVSGELRGRAARTQVGEKDRKFVASEAGHHAAPTDLGGESVRHCREEEVTVPMAEDIVDLLESVEIDD